MGDIFRRASGWYVRYKDLDGRRKTRASRQPTRELARRYLVEIEARVARGQVGIAEPAAPSLTVAELAERFLGEYSRPRIKDLGAFRDSARRALRRFLPLLGSRAADSLQSAEVAAARDAVGRTCAPASVKIGMSYLAAIYSWGMKQGLLLHNPVKGVERPLCQPSLDFFGREEVAALLKLADEEAAAPESAAKKSPAPLAAKSALERKLTACCLRLALHTGLRKGELLGLRWQDLNLEALQLTVARSFKTAPKSGKARHLRLPSICVAALRAWQQDCPKTSAGLVFPIRRQALDRHTGKLLHAAGCRAPEHPWHAMRHTFASQFVMAGGNILTLQRILGHSDIKMTMIYAHLAPDFLAQEMERVRY